jgi:hypothetical protein
MLHPATIWLNTLLSLQSGKVQKVDLGDQDLALV